MVGGGRGDPELRKDRFASLFREVEKSGIAIDPASGMQREEDQFVEMGAGTRVGRESTLTMRRWRRRVNCKTKEARRIMLFGKGMSLGGK